MDSFLPVKIFKKIKQDRFFSNSLYFFVGSFLVGVGNYFFQLLMARMLSVGFYGELQAILAILAVVSVITDAVTMVSAKYSADFKAKNCLSKVHTLFLFITKKISILAIIVVILFLIFSRYIAEFLNLTDIWPLIILSAGLLLSFYSAINVGVFQGLQKFKILAMVSLIIVFLKVGSAFFLVKLGFAINGAVGAVVIAAFIGYSISLYLLRFLFQSPKAEIQVAEIFRYFYPVFLTLLFVTLLGNVDMILVKHFFSMQTAGEYSALAVLGRVIFFITGPITGVMFSFAAAAHGGMADSSKILKKALFLIIPMTLIILLGYFLFADPIISIIIGSKFLPISQYLGWFGLAMFFYSLVSLFSSYFLSVGKIKCTYLVGVSVILQILLICIFHTNLWQIIWIMNSVMFFVVLLLSIYYIKIKHTIGQIKQGVQV